MIFRSQAIYGSLVETRRPYPCNYTKRIRTTLHQRIVPITLCLVNKNTNVFILFIKNNSVLPNYSHSIVAGGLEVISYTTRFTCLTSFTILVEMISRTSHGIRAQSEVIPSMEVTARIPTV